MCRKVGTTLTCFVALFVLIAGAAKLVDLYDFARHLGTWTVLPTWIKFLALYTIPPIEVLIGGMWLFNIHRKFATSAMLIFLLVVSGVYIIQVSLAKPPDCGCLGKIAAFHQAQRSASSVLIRNSLLILMLATGVLLPRLSSSDLKPSCRAVAGRASGFTLLETILVIAMVGLLMALLAPSLGKVRDQSQLLVSTANLRTHAQTVNSYLNDWDETFPIFTFPDKVAVFRYDNGRVLKLEYFAAHVFWNFALAPGYYDNDLLHPSFFSPMRKNIGYGMLDYQYACCFQAGTDFWKEETRTGPDQWRPVRMSEVEYPSNKGVFYSPNYDYDIMDAPIRRNANGDIIHEPGPPIDHPEGIGFVDGSALFVPGNTIMGAYPNGDGYWPNRKWPGTPGFTHTGPVPVLHTIAGSRGRDLQR